MAGAHELSEILSRGLELLLGARPKGAVATSGRSGRPWWRAGLDGGDPCRLLPIGTSSQSGCPPFWYILIGKAVVLIRNETPNGIKRAVLDRIRTQERQSGPFSPSLVALECQPVRITNATQWYAARRHQANQIELACLTFQRLQYQLMVLLPFVAPFLAVPVRQRHAR